MTKVSSKGKYWKKSGRARKVAKRKGKIGGR